MRNALISLSLLLAGCGDERPPAPTAEESERLDEAEAMLGNLANEEGPGTEVPDPSSDQDLGPPPNR